jgi:hypothetical protein
MHNIGFIPVPEFDDDGFMAPISVFNNIVVCADCNKLNFITNEIKDCRFCGPNKSEFEALVREVYENNLEAQKLSRTPRAAEAKNCKVCGRDHRKNE